MTPIRAAIQPFPVAGSGAPAERLATLTHDLLGAVGADRRLEWTNPAWERVLGWTSEELQASSYHELVHPGDLPRVRAAEEDVLAVRAGDRPETELRLRTRDGDHRWFVFSANWAPGEPYVYVSGKDVTARKLAEEELRAAEERFAGAFEGAAVGLALATPDGTLMRTNRALRDLVGRSEAELAGRALDDLLHPDERGADRAALEAMLAGRVQRLAIERRFLGARGGTVIARINLSLIRDADGTPLHFVAQIEDVTERRRMIEALTLSEARYRTLVAHMPGTAIVLFDHDLRLQLMEGDRYRGYGASMEGRLLSEVLEADKVARLEPEYRAALRGEERSFDWDEPSGISHWVQIVPLRDDLGHIIGGMALSRDVTEQRAAERVLRERARDLERSNGELEQFAYVASHDLSEPLRMVSSYLQLLRRRYHGQLDGDADDFIDYAVDGATRMRRLIDDLLTYSRAGREDRALEPVDSGEVARRVAEDLRGRERGAAARIEVGELPTVRGDDRQLGQLFQNLMGNAVKFVPAERTPEVVVTAERDRGFWRFAVEDNGIGLDAAHGERIFRMFQRLHSRDEYPGTGIGLAIAKKVVERHGGTIWVEPAAGGGTRFCFTLEAAA